MMVKRNWNWPLGLLLICLLALMLTACSAGSDEAETIRPETQQTEQAPSDPEQSNLPEKDKEPEQEAGQQAQTPEQPAAVITADEALALLQERLGDCDAQTGNEYSIGLESELELDGNRYYNFRVSWMVLDPGGGGHLSYVGNYLVCYDGANIQEYEPSSLTADTPEGES